MVGPGEAYIVTGQYAAVVVSCDILLLPATVNNSGQQPASPTHVALIFKGAENNSKSVMVVDYWAKTVQHFIVAYRNFYSLLMSVIPFSASSFNYRYRQGDKIVRSVGNHAERATRQPSSRLA